MCSYYNSDCLTARVQFTLFYITREIKGKTKLTANMKHFLLVYSFGNPVLMSIC